MPVEITFWILGKFVERKTREGKRLMFPLMELWSFASELGRRAHMFVYSSPFKLARELGSGDLIGCGGAVEVVEGPEGIYVQIVNEEKLKECVSRLEKELEIAERCERGDCEDYAYHPMRNEFMKYWLDLKRALEAYPDNVRGISR